MVVLWLTVQIVCDISSFIVISLAFTI